MLALFCAHTMNIYIQCVLCTGARTTAESETGICRLLDGNLFTEQIFFSFFILSTFDIKRPNFVRHFHKKIFVKKKISNTMRYPIASGLYTVIDVLRVLSRGARYAFRRIDYRNIIPTCIFRRGEMFASVSSHFPKRYELNLESIAR